MGHRDTFASNKSSRQDLKHNSFHLNLIPLTNCSRGCRVSPYESSSRADSEGASGEVSRQGGEGASHIFPLEFVRYSEIQISKIKEMQKQLCVLIQDNRH